MRRISFFLLMFVICISNIYSQKINFESKIKQEIINDNDGITGIYEAINNYGFKMACTRLSDGYKLTYYHPALNRGNTKALLRPTAMKGVFKATWILDDKSTKNGVIITFDGISMKVHNAGEEYTYLKMFPTATQGIQGNPEVSNQWSGTGFALKNGYIATNYHVVDGAKTISVIGVKGAFNIEYKAEVISTDKVNDLAIIKINDRRFSGFGIIPYRVKTTTSEVGEDIFVLGYPLTTTMGDEIKLTTGVISSKTGFQGDVSLYQISAPIQPGNSGGPLFDRNGNVVGIVNAKHQGAENVGYAIKASYLRNLMESTTSQNILPANNSISGQALTGKVKSLKNFVFMVKCSDQVSINSSFNNSRQNNTSSFWEYHTTQENDNCKIEKVVANAYETKVYFSYTNKYNFQNWYYINQDTYISCNNGNRLKIKGIENISYAPQKKYIEPKETISFVLSFPALPKGTKYFDLIEPGESEWKFYDIKIR